MSDDLDEHPLADAALALLEARAGARRLFAVLDGARDARLRPEVARSGAPARCLFHGVPPEVEAVSPWLVDVTEHHELRSWLIELGLGRAWGVFALTTADLAALERHLRQFLRVRREDGTKLLFRYYDPRVLRVYLPTCTPEELAAFFGPIEALWLDDRDPDAVQWARRDEAGQLVVEVVDLATAPPPQAALPEGS